MKDRFKIILLIFLFWIVCAGFYYMGYRDATLKYELCSKILEATK